MSTIIKTIKSYLTNDTIYPVTKADAVYLANSTTDTVETNLTSLNTLIGSSSISNVGTNITGIIGNNALTTSNKTLSGAINELNTYYDRLTMQSLTIVKASNSYTLNRGFAYHVGNVVTVAVSLTLSSSVAAGTGLFRLDRDNQNHSIAPGADSTGTTINWPLYEFIMPSGGSGTAVVTTIAQSGGHTYIATGSSIPANATVYVSGSFMATGFGY